MSKYNNVKVEFEGLKFDSKREFKRYRELKLLELCKAISDLRLQVPFELIPAQKGGLRKELPMNYFADFVYMENGKQVIEDVKGIATDAFVIKRKLMKLKGFEITVVK